MRPKGSFGVVESKVAQEVTRLVNACDKSQAEITSDIGLSKSNIITMFKQGRTKLPLNKVVPLARSCGGDPASLMMIALEEYHPDIIEALGEAFKTTVSEEESVIMRSIRHAKTVKEQEMRAAAKEAASGRYEEQQANLIRAEYNTSQAALKKLYDFCLKHLIQ